MNLFGISGIITGITSLLLSLIVLGHNYKNPLSRLWALFAFLVAIWGFGVYEIARTQSPEWALFWWRITHIGVILIPVISIHFTFLFLGIKKRWMVRLMYGVGIFFLILNTTPYFIANVRYVFNSFYYDSSPTNLYLLFTLFFFLSFIYTNYLLYTNYKKAGLIKQKQILYFFLAIFIGFLGGSTNFLPVFGVDIYPILNFIVPLYPIILLYAILKDRILNIKIITTELFTSLVLLIILGELFFVKDTTEFFIKGTIFLILSFFGYMIIRSVHAEVRAREKIEELAAKLEFANLRLKQLDEAKSDFLSIASHQLRTPLTAIKGYASMILEGSYGKISATTKSAVDKIFQSSQRLVLIIGDFLDISHIEQGTMQYDFAALDVKELAKGLTDEFKATIESSTDKSKALKISFEADEKENFNVNADRNKIRQVVSNLIDNSIKYTPAGFVKVSLSKVSENGNVLLKIEDSGIGLSAETMPNLFKKFGRARSLSSAYANGSGLGLYVAKEIIRAHKGKIWAESEGEGKGSKFLVELPAGK